MRGCEKGVCMRRIMYERLGKGCVYEMDYV